MGNNQNWMTNLAEYYETVRREVNKQDDDRDLIVLFDIDGTILDHRGTIFQLLKRYDRDRGTAIFEELRPEDVYVTSNHLERLLQQQDLPKERKKDVREYYDENRWENDVIFDSHQPYPGVMDVIRWFQLQPRTTVGLNTARPERLREKTLKSLNKLGKQYKVSFADERLHMNSKEWEDAISTKINGIRYFEDRDYRIVAMVDNEPANLSALSETEFNDDFLLLHAETCFNSDRELLPEPSCSGRDYEVTSLIQSRSSRRIQFVWGSLDSRKKLDEFLQASVQWGKLPVREDPDTGELIVRSETFKDSPKRRAGFALSEAFEGLRGSEKSLQLELNIEASSLGELRQLLDGHTVTEDNLGFRLSVEKLRHSRFQTLLSDYSGAELEVPIGFLKKLIMGEPDKSLGLLEVLINEHSADRFSFPWQTYGKHQIVKQLQEWGFSINLSDIPGLAEFLRADRLHPDSVTLTPTFSGADDTGDGFSADDSMPETFF